MVGGCKVEGGGRVEGGCRVEGVGKVEGGGPSQGRGGEAFLHCPGRGGGAKHFFALVKV